LYYVLEKKLILHLQIIVNFYLLLFIKFGIFF